MAKYYGEQPGWAQQVTQAPDGTLRGYNYSGSYGTLYKDANNEWNFRDDSVAEVPFSLPETKTDRPELYYGAYIKSFSDLGIDEDQFKELITSGFVEEGTDYHDMVTGSLTWLGKAEMAGATSEEHGYEIMLGHPAKVGKGYGYSPGEGIYQTVPETKPAGTGSSYLKNHNILGTEGVDLDPNQLIRGVTNDLIQQGIEGIFGVDKGNRSPTLLDYIPNLINQAPTNKQDMLIASAGDLTGLLGEKDTTTDADAWAKQEQVIKDKAGFGIVRPQDRMRIEKKEPGILERIRDTITPSAVEIQGNIIKSAFQGGDQVNRTDFKDSDIRSLFERTDASQVPRTIGEQTPFSDTNVYEKDGELIPHSILDKTWKDYQPNARDLVYDFNNSSNPLVDAANKIAYGYQNPLGVRGQGYVEINQPNIFEQPTAIYKDAAYLKRDSKDPNDVTRSQGILGGLLDKVTDDKGLSSLWHTSPQSELGKARSDNNIVGTEFATAQLPYSEWSQQMRLNYGFPNLQDSIEATANNETSFTQPVTNASTGGEGWTYESYMSMLNDIADQAASQAEPIEKQIAEYGPTGTKTYIDEYGQRNTPLGLIDARSAITEARNNAEQALHQKWEAYNNQWNPIGETDVKQTITNSWANQAPAETRFEFTGEGTKKFTENLWGINPGELKKTSGGGTFAGKYANFGHA